MENAVINYEDTEIVKTLRNTVAQGASDAEFKMFTEVCKASGLNPFKREIWFIRTKEYVNNYGKTVPAKVQIMTGLNGFYEIANRNPQFDGIEAGLINERGEWVKSCPDKFIGAWARVYRKDRKIPFEAEVSVKEFGGEGGVWKTKGAYMIRKVAESHALRKSFPQQMNGIYSEEELPSIPSDMNTTDKIIEARNESTEPAGPFYYFFPEDQVTAKFKEFLARRKAVFNEVLTIWESPVLLENDMPRLAQFRCQKSEATQEIEPKQLPAPAVEIDVPMGKPEVVPAETPLQKAQKRAAKELNI